MEQNTPTSTATETAYLWTRYSKRWIPVPVLSETKTQVTIGRTLHDGKVQQIKFKKEKNYFSDVYSDPRVLKDTGMSNTSSIRSQLYQWGEKSWDSGQTRLSFDAERALAFNAVQDADQALDAVALPIIATMKAYLDSLVSQRGTFDGDKEMLTRLQAASAALCAAK